MNGVKSWCLPRSGFGCAWISLLVPCIANCDFLTEMRTLRCSGLLPASLPFMYLFFFYLHCLCLMTLTIVRTFWTALDVHLPWCGHCLWYLPRVPLAYHCISKYAVSICISKQAVSICHDPLVRPPSCVGGFYLSAYVWSWLEVGVCDNSLVAT